MTETRFFDSLEEQLDAGYEKTATRRARRRRLARGVAGAAVGVLAFAGALAVFDEDDVAEAGVSVEERGGLVYIRLTDVEFRADVIEDAARKSGLDVTVEAMPVGPSLVGRFVRDEHGGPVGVLTELESDGPAFSGFVLPAGFDGAVRLFVGRPAKRGEAYRQTTNATSAGEPLACTGILGASPSDAVEIVAERGLTATWTVVGRRGAQTIEPDELSADLSVARVVSTAPEAVLVVLVEPGDSPPPVELTAPAAC